MVRIGAAGFQLTKRIRQRNDEWSSNTAIQGIQNDTGGDSIIPILLIRSGAPKN